MHWVTNQTDCVARQRNYAPLPLPSLQVWIQVPFVVFAILAFDLPGFARLARFPRVAKIVGVAIRLQQLGWLHLRFLGIALLLILLLGNSIHSFANYLPGKSLLLRREFLYSFAILLVNFFLRHFDPLLSSLPPENYLPLLALLPLENSLPLLGIS